MVIISMDTRENAQVFSCHDGNSTGFVYVQDPGIACVIIVGEAEAAMMRDAFSRLHREIGEAKARGKNGEKSQ